MDAADSTTSVSLLMRIRSDDRDTDAWRDFVDRYGKRIFGWCIHRRLTPDDAQDVTQEVLLKLSKRLGSFEHDETMTFRGWLRRVTENALNDFVRKDQKQLGMLAGETVVELFDNVEARQDLQSALEEAFDLELFEQAVERVRNRVASDRFQAWTWMAREGLSASEIAQRLGMKIATIYSARHYVQSLIASEVQLLESTADQQAGARNEQ